MINNRFLFFRTQEQFEKQKNQILDDSIVFVKNPPIIWTHGVYYTGGGGGTPESTIDIFNTPIYYHRFTNKEEPIPSIGNYEGSVVELSGSNGRGSTTISLNGYFLYLVVPNNITLVSAITSRQEPLSLEENFDTDTTTIDGHKVWIYSPTVAPENLSITFTFTVA